MTISKKVIVWIAERLLSSALVGTHGPIKIACFKSDSGEFYTFIEKTLTFLENTDLRRYQRVVKELQWISNRSGLRLDTGQYNSNLRMCSVNYSISDKVTNTDIVYFASVIVHEATHGLLSSKGFKYTVSRRAQIERICVSEGNRFLKKAAIQFSDIANSYIQEFNAENWSSSWKTPKWKKILDQLKRIARS